MEVNCGGKGVWYQGEVTSLYPIGEYQVKYLCKSIKWVEKNAVKGTGESNTMPLCTYGLVGWIVESRQNGLVVVRRPPQPLPARGFAATRRTTNSSISSKQVCDY